MQTFGALSKYFRSCLDGTNRDLRPQFQHPLHPNKYIIEYLHETVQGMPNICKYARIRMLALVNDVHSPSQWYMLTNIFPVVFARSLTRSKQYDINHSKKVKNCHFLSNSNAMNAMNPLQKHKHLNKMRY